MLNCSVMTSCFSCVSIAFCVILHSEIISQNSNLNVLIMNNQKMEIEQEMSTAGSESISNMLVDMDTHRVMINSKIEEEEYLFKLKGMKCFPRKDSGKLLRKNKKTHEVNSPTDLVGIFLFKSC